MGRMNAVLAAMAVMLVAGAPSGAAQTAADRQALGSQIEHAVRRAAGARRRRAEPEGRQPRVPVHRSDRRRDCHRRRTGHRRGVEAAARRRRRFDPPALVSRGVGATRAVRAGGPRPTRRRSRLPTPPAAATPPRSRAPAEPGPRRARASQLGSRQDRRRRASGCGRSHRRRRRGDWRRRQCRRPGARRCRGDLRESRAGTARQRRRRRRRRRRHAPSRSLPRASAGRSTRSGWGT